MSSFPETQSHVFFDETIFFISSLSVIGHAQIDNFTISPVAEVCCAFSNFIIKILFTSIYINNHSPHHSWSPHHLTSHFSKVFHHKVKLFRHWHLRRSGKRCFSRKTNTCSDINVRLKSPSGEKSTFTHKFIPDLKFVRCDQGSCKINAKITRFLAKFVYQYKLCSFIW